MRHVACQQANKVSIAQIGGNMYVSSLYMLWGFVARQFISGEL